MIDSCGRNIDYLRISVTDRCNYRCVYCMPETGVTGFRHGDLLTYEEIFRAVRLLTGLGIRHIRLTGGEPLARRGLFGLVRMIRSLPEIGDISLTTNGALLKDHADEAREAGVTSVNISLDTTEPDVFARITRGGSVADVLAAIDGAYSAGMRVKINAVPVRELNGTRLTDAAELARDRDISVRFIELMPVGCGASLTPIPTQEVIRLMTEAYGPLTPDDRVHGRGPATYLRPEGFIGSLGFISPLSHEFCGTCNRIRLTSDGQLKLCLNHTAGIDLRAMMRGGADDAELKRALEDAIRHKPARHGFGEKQADQEKRRMNQIGG